MTNYSLLYNHGSKIQTCDVHFLMSCSSHEQHDCPEEQHDPFAIRDEPSTVTVSTHTHTCMYPPHCQHHMQCTHSLLVSQHSILHAATRAHTLHTPGLSQHLVPCTNTTNTKRKGRGWKRDTINYTLITKFQFCQPSCQ